jgi:uncharacterized protein YjdB
MGRPINNSNFGAQPGKIRVRFHNGTSVVTGYIVKQLGAVKYLVTVNGTDTFTVDLVVTTAAAQALAAGQATIQITDANAVTRYITKLMSASCTTTDGSTLSWTLGAASAHQASIESIPTPPPAPTSITRSPATMTLDIGNTSQITASVVPAGAVQTVTYASSDATIATVSSTGLVTAVADGNATITITSTALNTVTATVAVTVNEPV